MPEIFFNSFHVETNQIKTITHDGRKYLVVPVVALVAGVVNGELAPAEEVGKYVDAWGGVPVPIDHPQINGVYVSAKTPELTAQALGYFWNPDFQNNRLKGEIWIDVKRANEKGGRIKAVYNALRKGELHEVSTAYFRDLEQAKGKFNGKEYNGIQRNLRPDHLAVLPDAIGACSIADGCGTPRANQQQEGAMNKYKQHFLNLAFKLAPGLAPNESLNDKLNRVSDAFISQQRSGPDGEIAVWPVAVFESVVIGRARKDSTFWAYNYEDNGSAVNFEAPFEVKRNTTYTAVEGGEVIANCDCEEFIGTFEAEDAEPQAQEETTEAQPGENSPETEAAPEAAPDQTNELQENLNMPELTDNAAQTTPETGQNGPQAGATRQPATNTQTTPETAVPGQNGGGELEAAFNRFLENKFAPYGGLDNALATLQEANNEAKGERATLIARITANDLNDFTAEELEQLPTAFLRKTAQALAPVVYRGFGGGAGAANAGSDPDFLPMPSAFLSNTQA